MRRLILAALLLVPMQAYALSTSDLLSLIAMPLAVAAVSDVTGVPTDELSNFVATLNNANVPPPQVIEVLRYVPVALVSDSTQQQPVFVDYVQSQVQQGVTGPALVPVIVERLRTYDIQPQIVTITEPAPAQAPPVQTIVVDRTFVPQPVITRVTEIRSHPHGGPPGQLKKIEGVQTGAQVVHGTQPGYVVPAKAAKHEGKHGDHVEGVHERRMPPQPAPMISGAPPQPVAQPPQAMPPGQAKKQGGWMPPGQAKKQDGGKGHEGHEGHGHENH